MKHTCTRCFVATGTSLYPIVNFHAVQDSVTVCLDVNFNCDAGENYIQTELLDALPDTGLS